MRDTFNSILTSALVGLGLSERPSSRPKKTLRTLQVSPTFLTVRSPSPLIPSDVMQLLALADTYAELSTEQRSSLEVELQRAAYSKRKHTNIVFPWPHECLVFTKRRKSYILNDGETRHTTDQVGFYWVITPSK